MDGFQGTTFFVGVVGRPSGTQEATVPIVLSQPRPSALWMPRELGVSPEARARHAESERRHANARSSWDASSQPGWLTTEVFSQKIQPLLAGISASVIRSPIGDSRWDTCR